MWRREKKTAQQIAQLIVGLVSQETRLAVEAAVPRSWCRRRLSVKAHVCRHHHGSLHMQRIGDDEHRAQSVRVHDLFRVKKVFVGCMRLLFDEDVGCGNSTLQRIKSSD